MAAPEIHSAFRGRLVCLLVLSHCGVKPMPSSRRSLHVFPTLEWLISFHSYKTKNQNEDGIISSIVRIQSLLKDFYLPFSPHITSFLSEIDYYGIPFIIES